MIIIGIGLIINSQIIKIEIMLYKQLYKMIYKLNNDGNNDDTKEDIKHYVFYCYNRTILEKFESTPLYNSLITNQNMVTVMQGYLGPDVCILGYDALWINVPQNGDPVLKKVQHTDAWTGTSIHTVFSKTFITDVDGYNGISGLSANGSMSTISVFDQDGRPTGTFENMFIENTGKIITQFTNGDTRNIAQLATAIFKNSSGLEKAGGNTFMETNASGIATIDSAINSNSSIISEDLSVSVFNAAP